MVINCTAGMEHKPQKIEVVVTAVEKYLGVPDLSYRVVVSHPFRLLA